MKLSIARLKEIIMEEVARATMQGTGEHRDLNKKPEPIEETIEIVDDE